MPNQYKAGTTSILIRMPQELKDRVYHAAALASEAYGLRATAQDIIRRAIEETCERIERETETFTAQIKNKR